jgi:ribonuclease E
MTDEAGVAAELETGGSPEAGGGETGAAPGRRRRRGGRGRGRRAPVAVPEGAVEEGGEPEAAERVGAAAEAGEAREVGTGEEPGSPGEAAAPARRRRRRGGRGRRKEPAEATGAAAPEGPAVEVGPEGEVEAGPGAEAAPEGEGARPRRRRRRRAGARGGGGATPSAEAAAGEATPSAEAAAGEATPSAEAAEPQAGAAGPEEAVSTRLLRAKVRARGARLGRRRREAPAPVPRVTGKLMVITEHGERDQIAVLEGRELVQHFVTRSGARSMVGNVYLGKVQNVLPGMEAAFVDIGRGRNAVLYAGEVNYAPEDLEGGQPRIERALRPGQSVLVQVTKDPMGGKGARLTAQISMPGRYLVLVPGSDVWGISRRLPEAERRRLKAIARKIKPEGHGLIVRTAAEGASEEAIAADLERLLRTWSEIEKRAKRTKAPALLYEEPELTVRVVRDLFTDEEFRELVTDSPRVYEKVTEYLREVAPDLAEKVRLHQGRLPVFEEFHITEQIHKALDRKVWLPSGGYIVIERTEAMTVIDVNTGKHTGGKNLEETVTQTNIEAAREIARQLRLRDIGGIIIIDFIDMLLEQNKRKVVDALKEALALDKTRSQVFDISPLGLLEVTRKRVSGGLLESFSETCPTCEGRGILVKYEIS